jgi:hypothetical protein
MLLADLNLQQLNNLLMSVNIQKQYIYCLIQSTINIHLKRRTSNTSSTVCVAFPKIPIFSVIFVHVDIFCQKTVISSQMLVI